MPRPKEPSLLAPDDIRLLTQIGFLAAGQADVPRAERIFGALAHVRPDRAFSHVGPAMALLNAGRAAEAAQQLMRALPQLAPGEDADTASALCALALQMEGRTSESTRLLRELLHNAPSGADNDGLRLARRMLGEPQAPASPPPLSP